MRALRALIVEDEAIIALFLKRELAAAGWEVAGIAATGAEAVRLALEAKPDVVLMDICLSGLMDGIEAAQGIRAAGGPPVVFCTSYDDAQTRDRASAAGALAFLSKPVDIKVLRGIVEGQPVDRGR
jgi:CheY-like chemotaxis protein